MEDVNESHTKLAVLIQIDDLCSEYESQFGQDKLPQIADFLDRIEAAHRGRLLHELVALEISLSGESVTGPSWSPDGTMIAAIGTSGKILVFNVEQPDNNFEVSYGRGRTAETVLTGITSIHWAR